MGEASVVHPPMRPPRHRRSTPQFSLVARDDPQTTIRRAPDPASPTASPVSRDATRSV
ncbi:hypothetical protein BDZ90DRAFT_234844 [Jaminaea rosea]|uniref:Uncharacterized protein n=1 Tax=Jaminaea rosea TaxID=1569628 RepID=A0A316UH31_9BASI|nr:hypothetical protein BDZ90DRAFT_234844 [Jaminaea rosea]PWN24559.1 hypothetical protein BDZ90DRAFT_234844 [Jaminaea rosea]